MRMVVHGSVLVIGSLVACLGVAQKSLANGHYWGHGAWAPTAYVVDTVPTAYVVPTSYVIDPTSYVLPTSYIVPTSYVTYPTTLVTPTAYVVDSPSYVATSYVLNPSYAYVRRGLFGRTYVATSLSVVPSYIPTVMASPAAYYTGAVLASTCAPCGAQPSNGSSSTAATSRSNPSSTAALTAPREPANTARATPSTVESVPATEARLPATAANPQPTTRRDTIPATGRPATGAADPNYSSPPVAPAQEKETPPAEPSNKYTPISPPGGEGGNLPAAPPVAPGGEAATGGNAPVDLAPVQEAGSSRYQVQKPVGPTPYVRSVSKGDLNKLQGKVISSETGLPEEGVRISIANRGGAFVDRTATTDALGRYAVTLPDGDWTVNVSMPSGRVYGVSQLTVSNGQIHDDLGRDIPSLTINR